MRHFVYIQFLTVFLLFPALCAAQSGGWKYLTAADQHIEDGNYSKARKALRKAQKGDYGFCGNAHAEAAVNIQKAKARIFTLEDKPKEAYEALNEVRCGLASCQGIDYLKVEALVAAYGKAKVASELVEELAKLPLSSLSSDYKSVPISLSFLDSPLLINPFYTDFSSGERAIMLAEQEGKRLTEKEKQLLIVQHLSLYSLLED